MAKPENSKTQAAAEAANGLLRDRKAAQDARRKYPLPQENPRPSAADRPQGLKTFIGSNMKYVLGVVIVVAAVALGLIIGAPLWLNSEDGERFQESLYVTPYDWSKLQTEGGHYSYVDNGEVKTRLGIDVSENQHWINWDAVAADGIDFAMIRLGYRGATEGDLYLDEYYQANMASAEAAGIDRGVYFFSQAQNVDEAVEEANFVLASLANAELAYPVAFDSEEKVLGLPTSRTTDLDKATMTAIAEAFCNCIEEAGYETVIYGNTHDLSRFRRSYLDTKEVWFAEYGTEFPNNRLDIDLWQYSNSGTVAGIEGAVDMNLDLRHALD